MNHLVRLPDEAERRAETPEDAERRRRLAEADAEREKALDLLAMQLETLAQFIGQKSNRLKYLRAKGMPLMEFLLGLQRDGGAAQLALGGVNNALVYVNAIKFTGTAKDEYLNAVEILKESAKRLPDTGLPYAAARAQNPAGSLTGSHSEDTSESHSEQTGKG